MTYSETTEYLYSLLPIYQRVGAPAYKPGLKNIELLCAELGNPQNDFTTIHIAGTNGKGSTSHYIASILQSAGNKNVGLHTSPHLKDFRERIKINGVTIPEKDVVDFVTTHKNLIEKIDCSFFELSVAMAFYFFAKAKCEVAVIEVGMGGRLDSTNIIIPVLSVITNISFDHMALLGDTLEKIAFEKAGIIKPGVPVVIGETQAESKQVFLKKAEESNSPITFADSIYKAVDPRQLSENAKTYLVVNINKGDKPYIKDLHSELLGLYQLKNIQTVLCAVDRLNEAGYKISKEQVIDGIRNVITQTQLLGRWQTLSTSPLTIVDTGHNEAGIKEVLEQLKSIPYKKLHFVFGVVKDKEPSTIFKLLPKDAIYYFCKANIPRSLDENELAELAGTFGMKGAAFQSVSEAVKAAQNNYKEGDLIFIGGSTFIVAEAI
ncbi:MAG TPA: folylpolyglutamate synthase/dihydrofolate synthase family protein [Bacteroidia bacterium]|nr:folylpolyglutamate synthase/dihydrofolate synthase family protein [Bacteroidia bacterium]